MMCACAFALYFGSTLHGYSIWYYTAAIAAANACFHIWGVIKLKAYSPGVVTGTLLYLPLFVIGTTQIVSADKFPLHRAIIDIVVAIGDHIFWEIKQRK
jgi:hypothetical protein